MLKKLLLSIVGALAPTVAFAADEILCLQQNIFFEARNQTTMGKTAVAWITLNRVKHSKYPDSVCEVVWQKKQFSWTHDGKSDKPNLDNAIEKKAWDMAGLVARAAFKYWKLGEEGPIPGAVMFHTDYVDPYWKSSYKPVVQLDSHIFYGEKS